MSDPTSLFIFVPAFGEQITSTTFLATHQLMPALAARGIGGGISTLSFPDIAELRNIAFTIWHDKLPANTHLLFIDADMGFAPDLVLDMILFNQPIVGALYRHKKESVSWVGCGTGEHFTARRGNFMKIDGVGMGVTLIRRDAAEAMVRHYPNLVDTRIDGHPAKDLLDVSGVNRVIRVFDALDLPDRGRLSEDLSFCKRWIQMGGEVWATIGHPTIHVGKMGFAGCFLEHAQRMQAQTPQAETQIVPTMNKALFEAQLAAGAVATVQAKTDPNDLASKAA